MSRSAGSPRLSVAMTFDRGHRASPLPSPEERPTLSVEETAAILGLGRNTVYDALRSGALPSVRVGRRYLVPTARLASMLGIREDPETTSSIAADARPTRSQPAERALPA
ncbi:MAG TPA: helix-turn-helix domain-containing protein [Acidimicrobiia bacterium]